MDNLSYLFFQIEPIFFVGGVDIFMMVLFLCILGAFFLVRKQYRKKEIVSIPSNIPNIDLPLIEDPRFEEKSIIFIKSRLSKSYKENIFSHTPKEISSYVNNKNIIDILYMCEKSIYSGNSLKKPEKLYIREKCRELFV